MRKIHDWLAKLPKPLKKWMAVIICGHISVALTALYSKSLAIALLWGYWHSESSIGYWMAMGFPTLEATAVAVLAGSLATLNWLWFANCAGRLILKKICNSIIDFLSKPEWPRFTGQFMSWLAGRMIPLLVKLRDADLSPPNRIESHQYLFLPIISFVPDGGVFVAISYVLFFGLNQIKAFFLITVGNVLKMFFWGYGFHFVKIYLGQDSLFVAAVLAFLLATILAIGKLLMSSKTK